MSTTDISVLERLRNVRTPRGPKAPKPIAKESAKTKARKAEEKKALQGDDAPMEKWHVARRKEATGTCQCGCGQKSCKNDDMYFRHSNAHILPKAIFPSVATHSLNCVERAFWGGCHTNMDEGGLDKWPNFADWEDIKERLYILMTLLTDEERATKFYQKLEYLVYKK